MDLQKSLDDSGYTQAVQDLNEAKAALTLARTNLEAGILPNNPLTKFLADLVELEIGIAKTEKALAEEYAATVKHVDAVNDLDLTMLDMEETAELVLEYMEKERPDSPDTAQVRGLVEKIRNKED